MKRFLLLFCLLSTCLLGQQYPSAIADDGDLLVAYDMAQSTLSGAINSTVTTFNVASASAFGNNMVVVIGAEQIFCTTFSSTTFSTCTRGYNSTTNVSHSDGTAVYGYMVSAHHNLLADEIIAIETALGANLGNVGVAGSDKDYQYNNGGSAFGGASLKECASGQVGILGCTSGYPALVRSGGALETKLADNSAYAQHNASHFLATSTGIGFYFGAGTASYPALQYSGTGLLAMLGDGSNKTTFGAAGIDVLNTNASQSTLVTFKEQSTAKWQIGKHTDNTFKLYDVANTANRMTISTGGEITITPASLLTISGAAAATPSFSAGRVAIFGGSSQPTDGNCVEWDASGRIVDAGAVCGSGSGSPGGSEGDIQFNISSAFAGRGVGYGLTNDGTDLKVDTSVIPSKSLANTFTDTQTYQGDVTVSGTNKADLSGAANGVEIPNGTGPTVNAAGEVAIDTDADGDLVDQGLFTYYDGTQQMYAIAVDTLVGLTDNYALTYDATNDKFVFEAQAGGGAPTDAQYWVGTADGTLSAEKVVPDGIIKSASGTPSAVAYGDVVGLWASGSCSGYLKNDGTCDTPAGGSASDTLHVFRPSDNEPPSSNYATFDTRNSHPVLDFDTSTDESAVFTAVLNRGYGSSGVTVLFHWAVTTETSGTVMFCGAFERIGDSQQDLDSDGFASGQCTAATTVPGTNGHVDITSATFTDGAQMDSVAAGEGFRLKVYRDVSEDSMADDAELVMVEIKDGTT